MAVSGVSRAVWYPLNTRGDGLEPLVGTDYALTEVGEAFTLLQTHAEGVPVQDISPDPFTYACAFGPNVVVIWGAPRALEVEDGVTVLGPNGREPDRRSLSRDTPLVLVGTAPITPGETIRLGPQRVIADTYDQFDHRGQGDGFQPFVLRDGEERAFSFRPGQETGGVPWVPYLQSDRDGAIRMNAEFLVPTAEGTIGHRYVAEAKGPVVLTVALAPDAATEDGVVLTVQVHGDEIGRRIVTEATETEIGPFDMQAGEVLEVMVGTGPSSSGDGSSYRFTLSHAP
jgi:hypothetical protein